MTYILILVVLISISTFHSGCLAQPYIQLGPNAGLPSSGDCFKDFQYLRERFNWEQLQFFCQQWRSYSEATDTNYSVITPFTENQLTYLRSLSVNLNATTNPNPMTVRKEYRTMSETERGIFHFVLRALKQQKIDGISKYDLLVMLSYPALAPGARVGAAFLPWHREYLRTFERAMQKINTFASLPYWDPTLDQGLPNPADSILWEPDFLGNGDGPVVSGPFAGWYLQPMEKRKGRNGNATNAFVHAGNETHVANASSDELLLPLTRNVSGSGRLMSPDDAEYIISRTEFRQFSACLDLRLEQTSRYVHEWVGGSMHGVYYSANDPVFFMFHCYVDYLWEEWRRNSTYEQRVLGYPPNHEACTKFHYATSPMAPFEPLTNMDGLSDGYTRLYFTYQLAPKCTQANPNCLSTLLFCHRGLQRCLSKIRPGGDCDGVLEYDPCYQSTCVNGKCTAEGNGAHSVQLLNSTSNTLGPISNALPHDQTAPAQKDSPQKVNWPRVSLPRTNPTNPQG